MASAILNSNLMEASLVPRGVSDSHSVSANSRSQDGFPHTSPLTPSGDPNHSFLHQDPFNSSYGPFLADSELQDNSVSGGEVTTEDEETSTGDSLGYYFKRSAEEATPTLSKKRRKQVKPIRVSSSEENSDNQGGPPSVRHRETSFYVGMSEASREENYEPIKCPYCHIEINSDESLRHHIIEDHIGRVLNEENIQTSYQNMLNKRGEGANDHQDEFHLHEREEGEMTPLNLSSGRWESRPTSQIQENGQISPDPGVSLPSSLHIPSSYSGDVKFGIPGLVPLGPPPFLLPFLQHQQHQQQKQQQSQQLECERLPPTQQPLRPVSNGQPQIFNLEAFCDLCNKEFCNKYFLKTHKANKHGIYSPDICSSQMTFSSAGLSTPLMATSNNTSSNISTSSVSTPLTVPNLQTSPLSSIHIPGPPFAGGFITANMSALPLRPLLPPHLHSLPKTPLGLSKNEIVSNNSKNGIINIEAYCEICQKEFCNKYFLKRHKSKIHNIDIEVTIKNTLKSPLPIGKSGYDRPEGWCDACRKDIGSRSSLNSHKLNTHGPNIIVPMSYPQDSINKSNPSQHEQIANKKTLSPESVNNNFSPWDSKREEKLKQSREQEVDERKEHSAHIENEILKIPTSLTDIDTEMKLEEGKEKHDVWDNRENSLSDDGRRLWKESYPKQENVSSQFEKSFHQEENTFLQESVSIKEEPQMNVDEHSNKLSHRSDPEFEKELNNLNQERPGQVGNRYLNKPEEEQEKEECIFKDFGIERRNTQTPIREVTDPPRTPGGGSSTDENSRELGLIARVGQPAIVQTPTGAKFTPDQLRQLGVINPDAFCELCCKEFCNKYFLRTHRIKKHGIYTPEYSDRSKHCKDHSPLSLARLFDRQTMELRPAMSEIEGEVDCDVCHRPFPGLHFLQMHKYYIHGPGQEIFQQEQIYQLQQQPLQQEHLRQLSLQTQQQKLQQQVKSSLKSQVSSSHYSQSDPQKCSQNSKPDTPNNHIMGNSLQLKVTGEQEDILRVPLRNQSNDQSVATSQISPVEINNETSPQEPDTSQGLRKLQSMILELNRQEEGSSRCKICQKDVGNKYFLRAHLMTEHGILPQEVSGPSENITPRTSRDGTPISSPSSTPLAENQGYCNICKKDFFSRYILQQHMLNSHGIFTPTNNSTSFLDRIKAEIESRDDRKPVSTSRSYCEICNKELCNKYFMKTHMLKMHGINVENGTSGGVTCDICKKELCSKYFLRVHKQNTHGLVEESVDHESQPDEREVQSCSLCSRRFKNLKWLQTHLNSDHCEEGKEKWKEIEDNLPNWDHSLPNYHLCNICGQQLPDLVTLQIHVIKNHGVNSPDQDHFNPQESDMKQNFECPVCQISFPSATLLYAHEKTHAHNLNQIIPPFLPPSHGLQCPMCVHVMPTIELYHQHLLHHHLQGFLKPLFGEENPPISLSSEPKCPDKPLINANPKNSSLPPPSTPRKRWRCYECGLKFKSRNQCLMHVQIQHTSKTRSFLMGRSPCRKRLFRCRKCGGVAKSLATLKKHFRKKHRSLEVLPTTHAQPSTTDGQFVMQPFHLNKEGSDGQTVTYNDEQPFVPSLVYLPVARKVQRPLTVSFCLTPA